MPFSISAIKSASDFIAMVSLQPPNSSGLIKTAAGRPFLVMTTSVSVE
jgi:hypothetical protein